MPRNVRNFWLEGSIDGRTSELSGGPQSKDGGFTLVVKQRHKGHVTNAGVLFGSVSDDGKLRLSWVHGSGAPEIVLAETER